MKFAECICETCGKEFQIRIGIKPRCPKCGSRNIGYKKIDRNGFD